MKISKIYTYPIKALLPTELPSVVVTKHGFPYDRRFVLLKVLEDGSHKIIAVAHFPETTRFSTSINIPEDGDAVKGSITVTHKPPNGEDKSIEIPLKPKVDGLEEVEVTMHLSPTKAYRMDQKYNDWFSSCFGFEVILAYLGDNLRKVLMSSNANKQQPSNAGWLSSISAKASELVMGGGEQQSKITFADCAPYLVCSDKSMEDVNSRLPDDEAIDILKFRPNIIVSGAEEVWEEDFWGEVTIGGDTKIECEHNCGRCKSINIDYETGQPGTKEAGTILKKLNKDRRVDPGTKWSPIFGRYSFLHPASEGNTIKVEDEVVVSKRNTERTRFDWEGLCTK